MSSPRGDNKRIFYGRRQGRKLRSGKRRLMAQVLPELTIDLAGGLPEPGTLFDPEARRVWLEIGFGAGEHLAAQAARHPEIGFIGCEPFRNGIAALVEAITREALANIRIYPDDARELLDALPEASIERCFVLFPDPWPKKRHHRRRFVSPQNLETIARVLADGGELRLASDHSDYVRWMLFYVLQHGAFEWTARGPDDWRRRPDDWPPTRYEEKALARGECCTYLRFMRRARSGG